MASIHAFTGVLAVGTVSTFWTPCYKRTKERLGYVTTGPTAVHVISVLLLSTKIRFSFPISIHFQWARSRHGQADGCLGQQSSADLQCQTPGEPDPLLLPSLVRLLLALPAPSTPHTQRWQEKQAQFFRAFPLGSLFPTNMFPLCLLWQRWGPGCSSFGQQQPGLPMMVRSHKPSLPFLVVILADQL